MIVDVKKDNIFRDMMNLVPKQLPAPEPKPNEYGVMHEYHGPGPRGMEGMIPDFKGYRFTRAQQDEIMKLIGLIDGAMKMGDYNILESLRSEIKRLMTMAVRETPGDFIPWGEIPIPGEWDYNPRENPKQPKSPALNKMREMFERKKLEEEKALAAFKKAEEDKKRKSEIRTTNEIRLAYLCANGKKASAKLAFPTEWNLEELQRFIQVSINGKPFSTVEKIAKRGYWVTADSFKSEPFPHLESGMVFKVAQEKWEPIGKHWVYTVVLTQTGEV